MHTEQDLNEFFKPIEGTPLYLIFTQVALLDIISQINLNPNYPEEFFEATGMPFEGIDGIPTVIFDHSSLACHMGLDGNEPDGLTLLERLLPGDSIKGLLSLRRKNNPAFIALMEIDQSLKAFAMRAEAEITTPREELIIESLSFILDRQLVREMEICPVAATYAQLLAKHRPEYFTRDALRIIDDGEVIRRAYDHDAAPKGVGACLTLICSRILNTL